MEPGKQQYYTLVKGPGKDLWLSEWYKTEKDFEADLRRHFTIWHYEDLKPYGIESQNPVKVAVITSQ